MKLLNVEKLNKFYGKNHVLRDVTFSMNKGDVVAIVGSSGGGKSTLLRSLLFLDKVSSGTITLGDETVVGEQKITVKPSKYLYSTFDTSKGSSASKMLAKLANGLGIKKRQRNSQTQPCEKMQSVYPTYDELMKIRLKMGMVFQEFNLFPHKTVKENLTLAPIKVMGKSQGEADAVAMDMLARVGLTDKANAYPNELSGGQKQRVAIARALCLNPEVLCFDEPTSALDPELTGEVLKVIKQLKNSGITMLIVTHELMFAREVADKVIFLDNGSIIEMGSAVDVIDNPKEQRTIEFMKKILNR